jgi:hypothetical protein
VASIAKESETTPQQVFLQYCVQSQITPLVGARSQKNLLSALTIANGESKPLTNEWMKAISRLMAEQSIINRYRGATLLKRKMQKMKKDQGTEKMKADQARYMQDTLAERERAEQEVVQRAKARAKALAEKLREET